MSVIQLPLFYIDTSFLIIRNKYHACKRRLVDALKLLTHSTESYHQSATNMKLLVFLMSLIGGFIAASRYVNKCYLPFPAVRNVC